MPEITRYEPGTPSWVDLGSPDPDASKAFYGALFGWEAHTSPDPEAGGYSMMVLDGHTVAGLAGLFNEGDPSTWTMYVSVDDAEATAAAIAEAGGTVFMPPFDVLDAGRMAMCADSQGARLSLWQPGTHIGASLVNEPGTLCWTELSARDPDAAKAFYPAVFGWEVGGGPEYTEWQRGGRTFAGMSAAAGDAPSQWGVCFAVADTDATTATAGDLGATVVMAPFDTPYGRIAVYADPHGAVFSVIQLRTS